MEKLDQHICFTNCKPSAFVDKFWKVRQMLEAWQQNMKELLFHELYSTILIV
jgi:hypothetical protein